MGESGMPEFVEPLKTISLEQLCGEVKRTGRVQATVWKVKITLGDYSAIPQSAQGRNSVAVSISSSKSTFDLFALSS